MSATLLDTHALLWWLDDDPRLGAGARQTIAEADIAVSIVTFWEIAVKHGLGKLAIGPEPVAHAVDRSGFAMLDLGRHHCFALARLPLHHRDPFDRMLVAQAQSEQMPILTSNRRFAAYEIGLLAANE